MADSPSINPAPNSSGFLGQKLSLILGHLYLLPWFARRCFHCELPLRPFLDANPELRLGGLPIASKLSRYGTEPPYLPSITIDETTDRANVEAFAARHSFPLIVKPLFGSHSREVCKVESLEEISEEVTEPMIMQPYVDAPREYGINVMRIGSRIKVYGLTEVTVRAVWGDGTHSVEELAAEKYGSEAADPLGDETWIPPEGCHVPLQVASCPETGCSFRDITDKVTPALRDACQEAADQIGLRFGRFDVKAKSLEALQEGAFYILEANGSPSLDLTLYDEDHSLSVKIERLRAHWDQFFQQARLRRSSDQNSWTLLGLILWFALFPKQYATSFGNEVNDGDFAPGA